MKILAYVLASSLIFSLTACEFDSPLTKLKSDNLISDLTPEFWGKEYDAKTQVWKDAVQFCLKNRGKPNCAYVMQIYIFSNGIKTAPPIGQSGNAITIPDFKIDVSKKA